MNDKVRLKPELKKIIDEKARKLGVSRSEVIAQKFADDLPYMAFSKIKPKRK